METHVEGEQAGEDAQALGRRPAALAAQPQRLKICVDANPGDGGDVAEPFMQLREAFIVG